MPRALPRPTRLALAWAAATAAVLVASQRCGATPESATSAEAEPVVAFTFDRETCVDPGAPFVDRGAGVLGQLERRVAGEERGDVALECADGLGVRLGRDDVFLESSEDATVWIDELAAAHRRGDAAAGFTVEAWLSFSSGALADGRNDRVILDWGAASPSAEGGETDDGYSDDVDVTCSASWVAPFNLQLRQRGRFLTAEMRWHRPSNATAPDASSSEVYYAPCGGVDLFAPPLRDVQPRAPAHVVVAVASDPEDSPTGSQAPSGILSVFVNGVRVASEALRPLSPTFFAAWAPRARHQARQE